MEVEDGFWESDGALAGIVKFTKDAVEGKVEPSGKSEPVPEGDWKPGEVRTVVHRSRKEILEPARPVLVEVYGKYRQDNDRKSRTLSYVADFLKEHDLMVAAFEATQNTPLDVFARDSFASKTEFFFFAPGKKPAKLKKDDPPLSAIATFIKKHIPSVDVDALKAHVKAKQEAFKAEQQAKKEAEEEEAELDDVLNDLDDEDEESAGGASSEEEL